MIELVPMDEPEFAAFLEHAIPSYAAEKVLAGSWTLEESVERSAEAYLTLLPNGLATAHHFLFNIREPVSGENVGVVWLADDRENSPRGGFIYELSIAESHRRTGLAQAAMKAIEEKARGMGIDTLRLHVFGQNRPARLLYEKLGYETTDINMAKRLL
ncbi:MAG TPA: GNAT family N-acetyltransferase [Chthoniobacterales bacterium]